MEPKKSKPLKDGGGEGTETQQQRKKLDSMKMKLLSIVWFYCEVQGKERGGKKEK